MAADNRCERPSRAKKESERGSNEGAELFSICISTPVRDTRIQKQHFYKKNILQEVKIKSRFLFTFLFALPKYLTQCHKTGCIHTGKICSTGVSTEMLLVAKKYTGTSPIFSTELKKPCELEPRSLPRVSDFSTSQLPFRCCLWNDSPELLCHHHTIENC